MRLDRITRSLVEIDVRADYERARRSQAAVVLLPFCYRSVDDTVYMNDGDQLNEFVLNDNGKLWQGTFKEPKGYQWFFGQFEAVVLPSVMMLLDRASIPHQDRADPVKMARTISAIVSASLIRYFGRSPKSYGFRTYTLNLKKKFPLF